MNQSDGLCQTTGINTEEGSRRVAMSYKPIAFSQKRAANSEQLLPIPALQYFLENVAVLYLGRSQ